MFYNTGCNAYILKTEKQSNTVSLHNNEIS